LRIGPITLGSRSNAVAADTRDDASAQPSGEVVDVTEDAAPDAVIDEGRDETPAETEPEEGPESEPEPEPAEAESESDAEPDADAEAEAEPEPDADAEATDPDADTEPAEVETAPAETADADSEPTSDLEPTPDPEPVADPEPVDSLELVAAPNDDPDPIANILVVRGLRKHFDDTIAVDGIDLVVPSGSFYGIVGPNGAGKTTTLSMITGLLRPDSGTVAIHGADVWSAPEIAKRNTGVLPDRLRLFDKLTGAQLLHYSGMLRGLPAVEVKKRTADLARVFGLEEAMQRLVSDYSAGMTKQVALAASMIHSPRLLVLDEPFESVDPVSAGKVTRILQAYVAAGGTVLLSSHSMELVERICDRVAVIVGGVVLADGTIDEVRGDGSLEQRFIELAGVGTAEGLEWLHTFSD
jgi:ABC-2 type transport system ATP-binding protein